MPREVKEQSRATSAASLLALAVGAVAFGAGLPSVYRQLADLLWVV
jgi:hypothetical protein